MLPESLSPFYLATETRPEGRYPGLCPQCQASPRMPLTLAQLTEKDNNKVGKVARPCLEASLLLTAHLTGEPSLPSGPQWISWTVTSFPMLQDK